MVNDSVTREAISKDQMRKFLKFVHDDVVYCKYYEVVYILFRTGMRISEFCGLTLKDIDLEKRIVNIDHQLQRTLDISVTMNVYTHIGFDDAEEELKRMEEFRKAQAEIEKKNEKPMSQKMFKAI